MKKSRHSVEQIIRILREANGGSGVEELKEAQRLRNLEKENRELKTMLVDQILKAKR